MSFDIQGVSHTHSPIDTQIVNANFSHISKNLERPWQQVYQNKAHQLIATTHKAYANNSAAINTDTASDIIWPQDDLLIVAQSHNQGMYSNNNGKSWSSLFPNLPKATTQRIIQDENTGYLYAASADISPLDLQAIQLTKQSDKHHSIISRSVDEGKTWQTLYTFDYPVVWIELDKVRDNNLYASVVHGEQGGIYVSENIHQPDQVTFEKLPAPQGTQGNPYAIRALNNGDVVTSWSGRLERDNANPKITSGIFISSNGGLTWQARMSQAMTHCCKDIVIDPHDRKQNTWYVGVDNQQDLSPITADTANKHGGLYKSLDRGKSWQRISAHLLHRVDSIAIDPHNASNAWVATTSQGLWQVSGLDTDKPQFTLDESFPSASPYRLFFNPHKRNSLWVTTHGAGIWRRGE